MEFGADRALFGGVRGVFEEQTPDPGGAGVDAFCWPVAGGYGECACGGFERANGEAAHGQGQGAGRRQRLKPAAVAGDDF